MTKSKKFRKVLAIMLSLGAVGGFGLVPGISPLPSVLAGPENGRNTLVVFLVNGKECLRKKMSAGCDKLELSLRNHWYEYFGDEFRLDGLIVENCGDHYEVKLTLGDTARPQRDLRDALENMIEKRRMKYDIKKSVWSENKSPAKLYFYLKGVDGFSEFVESLIEECRSNKFTGSFQLFANCRENTDEGDREQRKLYLKSALTSAGMKFTPLTDGSVLVSFESGHKSDVKLDPSLLYLQAQNY
jgi:hypothetical protein